MPETVAKALVLEAMHTAHRENRRLLLVAFSGPGHLVETELSLAPNGLVGLLGFLTTGFSGGTDLQAPVARVVERLAEKGWERADLLVVTDSAFEVPRPTCEPLLAPLLRTTLKVRDLALWTSSPVAGTVGLALRLSP